MNIRIESVEPLPCTIRGAYVKLLFDFRPWTATVLVQEHGDGEITTTTVHPEEWGLLPLNMRKTLLNRAEEAYRDAFPK